MPRTFDQIANLPLTLEAYDLEPLVRAVSPEFTRRSTVFHLRGNGEEGLGEDVTYDEDDQVRQQQSGPALDLAGEWTIAGFSHHVAVLDLFQGVTPAMPAFLDYRVWALESAALDLALRQAGRALHEVLGREPVPLRFAVSLRLGVPPAMTPMTDRTTAYGDVRFKVDYDPSWTAAFIEQLVAAGGVDVIDLKGAYKGTIVDVETDPDLYRRCAEAFPAAWLEDPDLDNADAAAALEPFRDRITWDAPIHSIADVEGRSFPPRALNCKPSRFGSLEKLFDFYDYCAEHDIALYGGGQSELGVGRGQIQLLAALFHPDAPNDVAPPGWDHVEFPRTGLPASPLDPAPTATGFRRRDPSEGA